MNGRRSMIDDARDSSINSMSSEKRLDMIEMVVEGNSVLVEKQFVLDVFEGDGLIVYAESRAKRKKTNQDDKHASVGSDSSIFVSCQGSAEQILAALEKASKSKLLVNVLGYYKQSGVWFPRCKKDLENCEHLCTEYDPAIYSTHPGFYDKAYRQRRDKISQLALEYRQGQAIPEIAYTKEETEIWGAVYTSVKNHHDQWACKEYLHGFKLLEENCGYSVNNIPQLQTVSQFLKKTTGFQLRPIGGLLTARDFLASLAFKVFQCTQYIRHHSQPHHTPEPDCCHELIGHVPMLLDPVFAQFSQEIGLASLGVSDQDIERLATLYWFTVEFGLCREQGNIKVYGAGLLSSAGELQHSVSDSPTHLPLAVETTSLQEYQDADYQPIYFVAESFSVAIEQVRAFSQNNIKRPFSVRYNEVADRIEIIA